MEPPPAPPMRPLLYNIGCTHSLLGNCVLAITLLEKEVNNGLRQRAWCERDRNLDPLRSHPRFHNLLSSLE
jgi:hypothetical protein